MGTPSRLDQVIGDVRVHQEDLTAEEIAEFFAHFFRRYKERIKHLRGRPLYENMPVRDIDPGEDWSAYNVSVDGYPSILLCCGPRKSVKRGRKGKWTDRRLPSSEWQADGLILDIRKAKILLCRNWWPRPPHIAQYKAKVRILSLRQLALVIKRKPWARMNTILRIICDHMDEVAERKAREAADLIQASGSLRDQIKRIC